MNFAEQQDISKSFYQKHLPLFYCLSNGVRYLEFDIWEGPRDGEPIIKIEQSTNDYVYVSDVLQLLVLYAFKNTGNPMILHLELHLSIASKFLLQELIKKILTYYLYTIPYNYRELYKYPTLQELQYRIVISGRIFQMEDMIIVNQNKNENKHVTSLNNLNNLMNNQTKKRSSGGFIEKINQSNLSQNINQSNNVKQQNSLNQLQNKADDLKIQISLQNQGQQNFDSSFNNNESFNDLSQSNNQSLTQITQIDLIEESQSQYSNYTLYNQQLDVKQQINRQYIDFEPQNEEIDQYMDEFCMEEEQSENNKTKNLKNFFKQSEKFRKPRLKTYFEDLYEDKDIKDARKESIRRRSILAPPIIIRTLGQMNKLTKNFQSIFSQQNIESMYGLFNVRFEGQKSASLWELYSITNSQLQDITLSEIDPQNYEFNYKDTVGEEIQSIIELNKSFLTKVIVGSKKQDNVNINMINGLIKGCQIIQNIPHHFDINNLIYQSFFQQCLNNHQGFILKPQYLRQNNSPTNNNAPVSIGAKENQMNFIIKKPIQQISLEVLCGHQLFNQVLTHKEMNIKIEVFVKIPVTKKQKKQEEKQDGKLKQQEQSQYSKNQEYFNNKQDFELIDEIYEEKIIGTNNFSPLINLKIEFELCQPEFSFLCFQVLDLNNNSLLGWYSLPCNQIRQGYRSVPLKDHRFNQIDNSFLLCKINKQYQQ